LRFAELSKPDKFEIAERLIPPKGVSGLNAYPTVVNSSLTQ